MSKERPVFQSYLYGRPVTEWSTPPPLSTQGCVERQLHGLTLEGGPLSSNPNPRHSTPKSTIYVDSKPLPLALNSDRAHIPVTPMKPLHKSVSTSLPQAVTTKPLSHLSQPAVATPMSKLKVLSSVQIPTALVTPLPGSSPPRHSSQLNDYQILLDRTKGRDGEGCGVVDVLGGSLKMVTMEPGLKVSDLPVPGDSLELIEKWKALIDTKDRILKQKNLQIERQKATISKLQEDVKEGETKLREVLVGKVREGGGVVVDKRLHLLEAENASIKAQLVESLSFKKAELEKLSGKLDHKEYELYQAVQEYAVGSKESRKQVASLHDEICRLQNHISQLNQKLAGAEAANKHYVEQIDQMNEYLGHMPSMEEHHSLQKQCREMTNECDRTKQQLLRAESELQIALLDCSNKAMLEQSLEEAKTDLDDTRLKMESQKQSLALLEPENRKLKQECLRLQKVVVAADRRCRQELIEMRERHRQRFVEATAKLRTQHKNLAKRAKALELQLTKNSDAMMALNSELQLSQGTIGALKTSVKDLVTQNQDLVEKNVSLQEVTAEAFKVTSSLSEAQGMAAQQLGIELSRCVEEFEALVNLSSSLLEGQEPTTAMLFGPETSGYALYGETEVPLEARLDQVKKVREKIEQLRTQVSEHFAVQISSACNVQ